MFFREGYRFTGWFEDIEDDDTRWNDDNEVTADITLYARWVEIPNPDIFRVGSTGGTGRVTSVDATAIARFLIGQNMEICLLAADVNGDGYVTGADIILLARWMVGHDVEHLIAH